MAAVEASTVVAVDSTVAAEAMAEAEGRSLVVAATEAVRPIQCRDPEAITQEVVTRAPMRIAHRLDKAEMVRADLE